MCLAMPQKPDASNRPPTVMGGLPQMSAFGFILNWCFCELAPRNIANPMQKEPRMSATLKYDNGRVSVRRNKFCTLRSCYKRLA